MKTSKRIESIKSIADSLVNYEWQDIDLILEQFQQPTSAVWDVGDKRGYVRQHLKGASDVVLSELMEYLVGENQSSDEIVSDSTEKIWAVRRFRLFISHLTEDKKFVTELKKNFASYGIDCFVAHQDIDPAAEWQDIIESALSSCDALTAVLTKNFHQSNWTDQEIGFCVARRVLVVPLKFELNPYGFIGKYQALNCKNLSPAQITAKIFDILVEHPLTSARLSAALVADFVDSESFESAKIRSLLLSRIKTWTPELLRSIENSLQLNSQIRSAFGVPERIRSILSEHRQQEVLNSEEVPF